MMLLSKIKGLLQQETNLSLSLEDKVAEGRLVGQQERELFLPMGCSMKD